MRFGGAGERGRGLIDISYVDQKEVNTQDRDTSIFPLPGYEGGVSSGIPPGRFRFCDTRTGCDPSIPSLRVPTWRRTPAVDTTGIRLTRPTTTSTISTCRIASTTSRSITWSRRMSESVSSARPNTTLPTTWRSGRWPASTTASRRAAQRRCHCSSVRTAGARRIWGTSSGRDHPFNPFGIDLIGNHPASNNLLIISRRPIEAGPLSSTRTSTPGTCQRASTANSSSPAGACSGTSRDLVENNATQTKHNQFNARALNVAMGEPDVCAATPGGVRWTSSAKGR